MPDVQHRPSSPSFVPGSRGRQHEVAPVLLSVVARDPGSRFAVLSAALFVATAACRLAALSPGASVAVVLVGLGAGCLTLPLPWTVAAGASAWASLTGFVVNTAGQLTTGADDVRRAGACLAVAVVAGAISTTARRAHPLTGTAA